MEKLRNETECCICTETFVDPRVLPCLHTFCLKCLQINVTALNRGPLQLMPCPVCRKEFRIPDSGLAGLQKNFVVERLIDIIKAPNPSTIESQGIPCEACLEEGDPLRSTTVPLARFNCADCRQRLCDECSFYHRKNKMTKLHTVSRLVAESNARGLLKNCVMRHCAKHRSDILIYCLDCMQDFCPRCSAHVHKLHRSSSARKIIDEYNDLVDAKVKEFMDLERHAQTVKEEVENRVDALKQKMDLLEELVTARSEKIKKLVDFHTKLLQEEIKSKKQKMLEDIKLQKAQLEKLQTSVIGCREDCSGRKEFATIEAVSMTMTSVKAKAEALTQQFKACVNCPTSDQVKVALKESDIKDFLGKSNVIGQIEGTKLLPPLIAYQYY